MSGLDGSVNGIVVVPCTWLIRPLRVSWPAAAYQGNAPADERTCSAGD
jgi:hypothetical protein